MVLCERFWVFTWRNFLSETNVSGLLLCPTQVIPKRWFLTKTWRLVKTQKLLYNKTTAAEAFNRESIWCFKILLIPVRGGYFWYLPWASQNPATPLLISAFRRPELWGGSYFWKILAHFCVYVYVLAYTYLCTRTRSHTHAHTHEDTRSSLC